MKKLVVILMAVILAVSSLPLSAAADEMPDAAMEMSAQEAASEETAVREETEVAEKAELAEEAEHAEKPETEKEAGVTEAQTAAGAEASPETEPVKESEPAEETAPAEETTPTEETAPSEETEVPEDAELPEGLLTALEEGDDLAGGSCGEHAQFSFDLKTGELFIYGTGAIADYLNIDKPWSDQNVTIRRVEIDEGITRIGAGLFQEYSGITSVVLPESLVSIGERAFQNCVKLDTIQLPQNLESIEEGAFGCCGSLEGIAIPEKVQVIGDEAFANCIALTEVSFPDGLKTVGRSAFAMCEKLSEIILPSTVTSIGGRAFDCVRTIYFRGTADQWANIRGAEEVYAAVYDNNADFITEQTEDFVVAGYFAGDRTPIDINRAWTELIRWKLVENDGEMKVVFDQEFRWTGDGFYFEYYTKHVGDESTDFKNYSDRITEAVFKEGIHVVPGTLLFNFTNLRSVSLPDSVTIINRSAFGLCGELENITLPESLEEIGEYAFQQCEKLKEISLGRNLSYIGAMAFFQTGLEEVTIPGNIEYFSDEIFEECHSLKKAVINAPLTKIPSNLFADCENLASVSIPETVQSIGDGAFSGCESLTVIDIPPAVTEIGGGAFGGTGISTIDLPDTMTKIPDYLFSRCQNLEGVVLPDGVTEIDRNAFSGCSSLRHIDIPSGVTKIGGHAFSDCEELDYLEIPPSVKEIGEYAFNTEFNPPFSIVFPDTDITFGKYVFNSYCSMHAILFQGPEEHWNEKFADQLTLPYQCKVYFDIPDPVVRAEKIIVKETGLPYDSSVSPVVQILPENVSVKDYALDYKEGLVVVNINQEEKSITTYTDTPCKTTVMVQAIDGSHIEAECPLIISEFGILEFTPDGAEQLTGSGTWNMFTAENAGKYDVLIRKTEFEEYPQLQFSVKNEDMWIVLEDTLIECDKRTEYPEGSSQDEYTWQGVYTFTAEAGAAYVFELNGEYDATYKVRFVPHEEEEEELPSGICGEDLAWRLEEEEEGSGTFRLVITGSGTMEDYEADYSGDAPVYTAPWFAYKDSIRSLSLPEEITGIGNYAFAGLDQLESAVIPESVTELGTDIFRDCTSLESANIPENITEIPDGMFAGCEKLKMIAIPDSVSSIGSLAFNGCKALADPELPENLTKLGSGAFSGCESIEKITVPESVKELPPFVFDGCKNLKQIKLPDRMEKIGARAFRDCENLAAISIPAGIREIPAAAFSGCTALQEVVVPEGVETIGPNAFQNCTGLTLIEIPESVTAISPYSVFSGDANVTIRGYEKSEAERYAGDNGIPFDPIRTNVPLQKIAFKTTSITIAANSSAVPAISFTPEDATNRNVTFTSSNPAVATVDAKGKVTGKKVGNAVITAVSEDGAKKASCKVRVLFSDVTNPKLAAYDAIYWGVDKQYVNGYGSYFDINGKCTRAQFVLFLWRTAGRPKAKTTALKFKDKADIEKLAPDYKKAILWGSEKGIVAGFTSGVNAGKFLPNDPCTRGQVVTFLWRYKGKPTVKSGAKTFPDVPKKHKYYQAVMWASGIKLTTGFGDGTFRPDDTCTRGQCVTFLYRMMK